MRPENFLFCRHCNDPIEHSGAEYVHQRYGGAECTRVFYAAPTLRIKRFLFWRRKRVLYVNDKFSQCRNCGELVEYDSMDGWRHVRYNGSARPICQIKSKKAEPKIFTQ